MQQNKKMMEHIDNLNEKIEEQDEKLLKHDKLISDILKNQNKMMSQYVAQHVVNPAVQPTVNPVAQPAVNPVAQSAVNPVVQPAVQTTVNPVLNQLSQLFTPTMLFTNVNSGNNSNIVEIVDHDEDYDEDDDCCVNGVCPLPSYLQPESHQVEELEPEIEQVQELEQVVVQEPQKAEESSNSKKRKKKKKKSVSLTEIDKELEDELNELYKEEIIKDNS
jgi:hypothetical protein